MMMDTAYKLADPGALPETKKKNAQKPEPVQFHLPGYGVVHFH